MKMNTLNRATNHTLTYTRTIPDHPSSPPHPNSHIKRNRPILNSFYFLISLALLLFSSFSDQPSTTPIRAAASSTDSSMESTDSSMGDQQPHLPPGFRFHPTDEELVVHYLKKRATSAPLPVAIIAEVDLYKFDPWELPAKAAFGEQEWYFFSPRDRKYPNGARPNRAATSGYWKATGTDKPVLTSGGTQKVGVKKALVFYGGKPPKGVKTNWIMHEYRLTDNKLTNKPPGFDSGKKNSLRLDDWVLCRIYKKNNTQRSVDGSGDDHRHHVLGSIPAAGLKSVTFGGFLENEHHLFDGMLGGEAMVQQQGNIHLKRSLPSLHWPESDDAAAGSSGKRYQADSGGGEAGNGGAVAALLGNLPPTTAQLHQQAMIGDGYFRQQFQLHGMNWYS